MSLGVESSQFPNMLLVPNTAAGGTYSGAAASTSAPATALATSSRWFWGWSIEFTPTTRGPPLQADELLDQHVVVEQHSAAGIQ